MTDKIDASREKEEFIENCCRLDYDLMQLLNGNYNGKEILCVFSNFIRNIFISEADPLAAMDQYVALMRSRLIVLIKENKEDAENGQ